jgi:hypothetical protein
MGPLRSLQRRHRRPLQNRSEQHLPPAAVIEDLGGAVSPPVAGGPELLAPRIVEVIPGILVDRVIPGRGGAVEDHEAVIAVGGNRVPADPDPRGGERHPELPVLGDPGPGYPPLALQQRDAAAVAGEDSPLYFYTAGIAGESGGLVPGEASVQEVDRALPSRKPHAVPGERDGGKRRLALGKRHPGVAPGGASPFHLHQRLLKPQAGSRTLGLHIPQGHRREERIDPRLRRHDPAVLQEILLLRPDQDDPLPLSRRRSRQTRSEQHRSLRRPRRDDPPLHHQRPCLGSPAPEVDHRSRLHRQGRLLRDAERPLDEDLAAPHRIFGQHLPAVGEARIERGLRN